jgi:probable HAF family extracellular repeat protein
MRRLQIAATCGVVLLMNWPSASAVRSEPALYAIEDLGTLNGAPLTPHGINTGGHVAGTANGAEGARLAFLIDGGTAHDLGSPVHSEAYSVSDHGVVVGFSLGTDWTYRAFRWTAAAGMTGLAGLEEGPSFAFAINEAGQIAGYAGAAEYRAFRYTEGAGPADLGTLGGSVSLGYGINASGQVTGCSWTAAGETHAFVSSGSEPMQDLGTLGGTQSCGVAINGTGVVAGSSYLAGDAFQHAVRFAPGTGPQDLGTLGGPDSAATALNDAGVVVGWSTTAAGEQRAFVFTSAEGMTDLNNRIDASLGWTLVQATGINAGGQVVGVGLLGGTVRAFRLTPPPTEPEEPPDTTPPAIRSLAAWPSVLWPPLHQMVAVRVRVTARDAVDPSPVCRVTSVTSSEPDAGTSRQDRPNDIVIRGDLTLRLRAELGLRSGTRSRSPVPMPPAIRRRRGRSFGSSGTRGCSSGGKAPTSV